MEKTADDADPAFSAELAALVRSGTASDEEVCAFVRRKFFGKRRREVGAPRALNKSGRPEARRIPPAKTASRRATPAKSALSQKLMSRTEPASIAASGAAPQPAARRPSSKP